MTDNPSSPNGGAAPGTEQAGPRLSILTQYVKDLSFENPRAPYGLQAGQARPEIQIQVDVRAAPIADGQFEVAERREARDVLQRNPLGAAADGVLERAEIFVREGAPRERPRLHSPARVARDVGQQQFGVDLGVEDAGRGESGGGVLERCAHVCHTGVRSVCPEPCARADPAYRAPRDVTFRSVFMSRT